jgi:hypothetical protein
MAVVKIFPVLPNSRDLELKAPRQPPTIKPVGAAAIEIIVVVTIVK